MKNDIIKERIQDLIVESLLAKQEILETQIDNIRKASLAIVSSIKKGGKVMIFGNGGSASDSQHMAAELVSRFQKNRRAIAAIALTTDTSILTAIGNDLGFDQVYKRQIEALGSRVDTIFAISTSGRSKNIIEAVKQAKKQKIKVVGLTGRNNSLLSKMADISINVPSNKTARIQEGHILICHIICELVEEEFSK